VSFTFQCLRACEPFRFSPPLIAFKSTMHLGIMRRAQPLHLLSSVPDPPSPLSSYPSLFTSLTQDSFVGTPCTSTFSFFCLTARYQIVVETTSSFIEFFQNSADSLPPVLGFPFVVPPMQTFQVSVRSRTLPLRETFFLPPKPPGPSLSRFEFHSHRESCSLDVGSCGPLQPLFVFL